MSYDMVCLIKQVPDTRNVTSDVLREDGTVNRQALPAVVNPDDLFALEMALGVKDKFGGKITVISMGPPMAVEVLKDALSRGADHAILLTDKKFAGADTLATSHVLESAIRKNGNFNLIFCGRQAIDGDTAQIGPQVADFLQIPQVTYVSEIEKTEKDRIIVKRRLEDGYERIECRMPALLTVLGELNTPRYPDVGRVIAACLERAPIKIWNAADIGVTVHDVGLEGSLTHVIKTYVPRFKRQGEILEGETNAVVKELINKLGQSEGATACKAVAAACRLEVS